MGEYTCTFVAANFALRFLAWSSLLAELIISAKRGLDVLELVLRDVTPCILLGISTPERRAISIFRVEGTLNLYATLCSRSLVNIKLGADFSQKINFNDVKFMKKLSRRSLTN
jgi:hypothetical protein